MNIKPEQVFSKTLKGIDAARGGGGLSPKILAVLKLVDGAKDVAALAVAAKANGAAEADCHAALNELLNAALVRVVERVLTSPAQGSAAAEVENQLLLTLDFTKRSQDIQQKAATTKAQPAAQSAPGQPGGLQQGDPEERAREARTARLKMEAEIRQKLVAAIQPCIEEELRKRLRPKLEEELRPKLIAALRPGLEAEIRTALVKELTPRVELERPRDYRSCGVPVPEGRAIKPHSPCVRMGSKNQRSRWGCRHSAPWRRSWLRTRAPSRHRVT